MKTALTSILGCLLLSCASVAVAAESPPLSDSRIKMLPYDEGDVYTITTRYGYQTNIVFGQGEDIQTISIGDRSLWQIIPSGNRLFIRPIMEGMATNMTVLTNKHSYQFDLKSAAADDKETEIIYVAKFSYPDKRRGAIAGMPAMMPPPMPVAAPPVMPPVMPPPIAEAPPAPNYNYTYSGPDVLAPLQVFDNGRFTFVKYHTMPSPLPETYLVDGAGRERPVAHTVKDNLLIVEAVAGTLALRTADGAILVYNETLNPQ